ncbi:MAG TPA: ATP-binding protein, partial [Candidatus Thermoplasmatota archaeon]|nr:ATP-binding protein [Candidatus Thermoplasmatota archaeon]
GGHAVELQVRDLGRGLAQAEVGKLFQPFAQVEGGTHHGTGLGLYLSKAIVDAHGGSIRLESQGLGKGTTATVELPCRLTLAQVDAQEAAGQRPQDPVPASP